MLTTITPQIPGRSAADKTGVPDGKALRSGRDRLRADAEKLRLLNFEDLDGRSRACKIAKQLILDLESDLGGEANITTAERELIKRAAMMGAILGDLETTWMLGEPADLSLLGTLADRQRRILESLGLKRRARDLNPPTLADYLRDKSFDTERERSG